MDVQQMATCADCGGVWFDLVPNAVAVVTGGNIRQPKKGVNFQAAEVRPQHGDEARWQWEVAGYCGEWACVDCGSVEFNPIRDKPRPIQALAAVETAKGEADE